MERDDYQDPDDRRQALLDQMNSGDVQPPAPDAPAPTQDAPAPTPPPDAPPDVPGGGTPDAPPQPDQHISDPPFPVQTPEQPAPPPPEAQPAPPPAEQPAEQPAPPPAAPADPWAGLPGNYATVRGYYQQYLGRDAENPSVVANWLNGTQGRMDLIEAGIKNSDEAKAHAAATAVTPPTTPTTPPAGARPTGGQLTDPAFAAKYVAWAGTQAGVNPSVKNDPNYWIGRFTSGAFGNDQDYALMRMLQPEGPPEGAKAAPPPATTAPPAATTPPPVVGSAGPPGPGGGYVPPPAPPAAGTPVGYQNPTNAQQFGSDVRNQLLNLLQQPPVSENDSDVAPAITAYRNSRMRLLRETQDQNAESANARGLLHSGAYDAATARDNELAGGDIASYAGNAVQAQATARRNQITQLLQTGAGILTADQASALQAQVANIDAYLRQQSISNQSNQFYDAQSLNASQFGVTANNNALRTALGL